MECLVKFVLFFILHLILLVFFSAKVFKKFKFEVKIPDPKILKYFLLICFLPNICFLFFVLFFQVLVGKHVLGMALGLTAIGFLYLWFFVFRSKFGLNFKKAILFLPVYFVISLSIAFPLHFFLKAYNMPAGSMEDTIQVGDYLLSDQFYYGHSFFHRTSRYFQFNQPQRGDLIVFVYPVDESKDFIKRCVGVPGDIVEMKNASLYVNNVRQVEPYAKHIFTPAQALVEDGPNSARVNFGPVTVEPGRYFMMGDNRDNSLDSRYWGQLDEKMIKGKAELVYWSDKDQKVVLREIH